METDNLYRNRLFCILIDILFDFCQLLLSKGRKTKRGIATIDGYYLVATKPKFGRVGDRINIILEDGTKIKAIQADTKGNEHQNEWGHNFGGGTSLVEWELDNSNFSSPDLEGWQGKKVSKINNLGSYI